MAVAKDFKYFYEDEVWRVSKKGVLQFGMVIENAEFVSSDEESGDEEEEQVKMGTVRVAWYPAGTEEVVPEKKIHLADRSLMPGDIVRRMRPGRQQRAQRGVCRRVHVHANLQILGTKQVIYGVKSSDLVPLEEFKTDILVCKEGWVGIVRSVKARLTLRFSDGSKVMMEDSLAEELDDIMDKRDSDCEFKRYDFYPGQILFGPIRILDCGEWVECSPELENARKNKPHKAYKVTVEELEFQNIGVNWLCRSEFGNSQSTTSRQSKAEQPPFLVPADELKQIRMLNVFEPCTLQIGDRNFYTLKETDAVISKAEWKRLEREQLANSKAVKQKKAEVSVDDVSAPEEATKDEAEDHSSEFEDIEEEGEDNNKDSDTASVSSHRDTIEDRNKKKNKGGGSNKGGALPALPTRAYKKMKLKLSKKAQRPAPALMVKAGMKVVTETLSTHSEVDVVWQDGTEEAAIPSIQLYPIQHLDDHEFFPGDFVTETKEGFHPHNYGVVQTVDHAERTCRVRWMRTYTEGRQPRPVYLETTEASAYDLRDHPDFRYRPGAIVIRVANWDGQRSGLGAGQVLDMNTDGEVMVWWAGQEEADDVISACWPQDLYKVGEYDSDEGELWADGDDPEDEAGDEGDSQASWTTESEAEVEQDDSAVFHTDEEDKKAKLLSTVEKARQTMAKLEEVMRDSSRLHHTPALIRRLLQVCRDCFQLDRNLGTQYFHESHFFGLLDRIKDQDRISTVERAVKDRVSRLFSSDEAPSAAAEAPSAAAEAPSAAAEAPSAAAEDQPAAAAEDQPAAAANQPAAVTASATDSQQTVAAAPRSSLKDGLAMSTETLAPVAAATGGAEGGGEAVPCHQSSITAEEVVGRLCSQLKSQLTKAQLEAVRRYAETRPGSAQLMDLVIATGGSDDLDLNELVASQLAILDFVPFETAPAFPIPSAGTTATASSPNTTADVVPSGSESLLDSSLSTPADELLPLGKIVPLSPGSFATAESVPAGHKFKLTVFEPANMRTFAQSVRKEVRLLQSSLPPGITVRGYEERMDLYSAMIEGPKNTPYEDGVFFFDFQLGPDYPSVPPTCHYISYCTDRLNPNLYEEGKVCVSLLGTWNGRGTETWTPNSNLLQLLVSIQGLILVREPYFNEAGFEKQKGTQQGAENSRMYNEMVVLKLVQSMTRVLANPPEVFKKEIVAHFSTHAKPLIDRLELWSSVSQSASSGGCLPLGITPPDFPLIPASRGFCLTLARALEAFKAALATALLSDE